MFDDLRTRWSRKQIIGVATAALLLLLFLGAKLLFEFTASPDKETSGVVLSLSATELARAHGATHAVASVQLTSGQVISASVLSGGVPSPGSHVKILVHTTFSGVRRYDLIGLVP
jgi:hypothetical protein